jgi:dTDP-4-amino-4,6-dideoxygalactose transaminase
MIGEPAELSFPDAHKRQRRTIDLDLRANADVHIHDIWYDSPIAPPRYIDQTDYSSGLCKNSEATTGQLMNLPTHRNISVDQATKLAERIAEYGTKY